MQMQWRSTSSSQGEKVLHIRVNEGSPWKIYTAFPEYCQPDLALPGIKCSKGFRTAQHCLGQGFKYVASEAE